MVMQMLTGREVLRTHFPWQLMMKHPMWMAFQCRRQLQGFDERDQPQGMDITLVEAEAADNDDAEPSAEEDSTDGSNESNDDTGGAGAEQKFQCVHHDNFGAGDAEASAGEMLDNDKEETSASKSKSEANPAVKVKVRLKNDTFYDDYLHRGDFEPGAGTTLQQTPLRRMSLYLYASFVRIIQGDPDDLGPRQFAFSKHHTKYKDYVQEMRPGCC